MRLPDLLTSIDLPAAELHALRLDGTLYAVAGGWRPSDLPETAEARASAVGLQLTRRLIADRLTAAWILGAAGSLPWPVQCCTTVDARGAAGTDGLDVRELRLDAGDVTRVGELRITTPLRTAADLLRGREWREIEQDAAGRLVEGCGPALVRAALDEPRFSTHRTRAVGRLRRLETFGATRAAAGRADTTRPAAGVRVSATPAQTDGGQPADTR